MKQEKADLATIKSARSKFLAMATAYCLGVFNDNYFKQAALLVAVTAGLNHLQGTATMLFALPFILFSSYAGWLADRFPKKNVVIGAKGLEVLAMLIGAAGLITGNWMFILAMVFLMGAQSTFFSPALNGSIPELYPATHVPKANAILKLFTTLAILAGIATSGISLDQQWLQLGSIPSGLALVALVVVLVALFGFFASFGAYSKKAASTGKPFPWFGPVSSLKDLIEISKDRQLLIAITSDAYFYFLASITVLTINILGLQQIGYTQTITSLLSMCLMLGVCIGSFIAAKIMSMKNWSRHIVIAASGMSAGLLLAGVTAQLPIAVQHWWLVISLITTGIAGGLFLIPVTSFLQVHPADSDRGRVLATANFCGFVGILASGSIFNLLNSIMTPTSIMISLGLFALVATSILAIIKMKMNNDGKPIIGFLIRRVLSLRYSVEVKGLETLDLDDKKGIIFLPNHPALIDPVIVMSSLYSKFSPRPLSDIDQVSKPFVKHIIKLINPITLPDLHKNGRSGHMRVKEALNEVSQCLKNGEQIIMYPAGRVYRSAKEVLAGNSGVETIIKNVPDVQVVLVRTKGLWGSSFGRAGGGEPSLTKYLKKYLLALITNWLFFSPRRKVTIDLVQDTTVATLSKRREINSYLERFYNSSIEKNTHVSYFLWQGRKQQILPEPAKKNISGNIERVPASITKQVKCKLQELTGVQPKGSDRLANDLAMDSLTIMELTTWLENEFGIPVEDTTILETVDDCVLAASGQIISNGEIEINNIPAKWHDATSTPLVFEKGQSITASFLQQASKTPNKVLLADQISGTKTYRNILTAIFVLKPIIEKMEGKYIGIMLPATVSASIVYLATLFSGKTPVMFNWTGGLGNMAHGLTETGVSTIITASPLYQRIEEQQSVDLSGLETQWLFLDKIVAKTNWFSKIYALGQSYFSKKTLAIAEVSNTAAILFTSGSESKPKAVPLSHENIITNMTDFSNIFSFTGESKLLGMLPPFHSLGLVGTIILPICMGLKTVYHPNPTEPVTLAKIIRAYKVTMAIGTPTFIDGILNSATPQQLESLRLVFTGAEKCPAHVYQGLRKVNSKAQLCEGYGITECSPLVSINTPDNIKEGTIGTILPSIDYAIVDTERGKRAPTGEKGILLLRGASIFFGYLNDYSNKGFYEFEGKLWYHTGDFVKEDKDGTLTFCGRKKRFIKLAGEMISLPAIENALMEKLSAKNTSGPVLAVEATAIDGHPEIVLFSTIPVKREEINTMLKNAGLSALHNIRRLKNMKEIPLLGTGKTDYKVLQQMIAV